MPQRRRIFQRRASPLADAVLTHSQQLREYHPRPARISPERLRVIYNGVDTLRFAPRLAARLRLRQELGIPADALVLGSVGRLVPIKDHGTLLRAASVLVSQGANVRVVLVGAGSQRDALQKQTAEDAQLAGRVIFTGASENIPDLLNAMDVFVLPSLGEGMSNTLLEAMASAL